MDSTIPVLLLSAGLLTLLAIYRRWKHKSAFLLNILASIMLYCSAAFRSYGQSLYAIMHTYEAMLSYQQGQVFFATIIIMPWLLSHIVGRLLRLIDKEKERAAQKRAEAKQKAEQQRLLLEEAEREDLREIIKEISDYQMDILPFLAAVDAGGHKNARFSAAVAGCKKHAQGIRNRCERLNRIAEEMSVTERASVFVK